MNTTKEQPQFEPNGFYERIISLRKTDPKAFNSLSSQTLLSLGAYEAQKRVLARLQAIRDEPEAA